MEENARAELIMAGAAAALGVLAGLLLRGGLGINVPVMTAALAGTAWWLSRRMGIAVNGEGRWLWLPALLAAGALAWRDAEMLQAVTVMTLLVCLGLALWQTRSGQVRIAFLTDYLAWLLLAAAYSLTGAVWLARSEGWRAMPQTGWSRLAGAVGRGLLIALPLLLVFGSLLTAADPVFADLAGRAFDWDAGAVASHLLRAAFWSWLAGGFLHTLLLGPAVRSGGVQRPAFLSLGMVETVTVLGLLNALFLAFLFVQFRYFFGGAALVEASTTLTYAEYARNGFFELVAVAGLVLPLLLAADWLVRRERPAHDRLFRVLAAVMVAQLFVMMFSALQRMRLYVGEFGLTELRLYVTAFMGWLAAVFVWFLLTVLRGRRERFIFGALVAGLVLVGALHALNPDALIVRVNTARMAAGHELDAHYAASLSADAVPELIAALPAMPPAARATVAEQLLRRWQPPAAGDWRSWNWSRRQAYALVEAHRGELEAAGPAG